MAKKERMDPYFSVFNLHVNQAGKRADREFEAQWGRKIFEREIKPLHDEGVMVVFQSEPTPERMAWVALVTAYANENVPYRLDQLRREREETVSA